MSKVLVTGGSGFIGTNMIESLLEDGHVVLNIDKSAPVNKKHDSFWKQVNILDFEKLKEAIELFQPEIIIHFAAVTDLNGENLDYYSTNTDGTKNIIDISERLPSLKKAIFTSSMYISKPGIIPPDFETYKPHTVYGESKVVGEQLVKAIVAPKYEWVIIRPTSIWGPWFSVPYIDFFNVVYNGKYFDFGKACTKTYGYVGNTVYQIRKLIDAKNVHGKTFYLGDLPATQIAEWGNEISVEMKKGPIKKVPYFLLKSVALVGDLLALVKIKFPLTSFRLYNMTTNNVLPLTNTYEICGQPPFSRIEGNKGTLKWLQECKGYKF